MSNLRKLRSSFSNVDVGSSNLTQMSSYQIGAFIAEPVMGAGGVIPPPATYFEKVNFETFVGINTKLQWLIFFVVRSLWMWCVFFSYLISVLQIQAVVKKYDILFIADEVYALSYWTMFTITMKKKKDIITRYNYVWSIRWFVHLGDWGQCLAVTNTTSSQILCP